MKPLNSWQHDIFVQSLYSTRGGRNNASFLDYSLAQARSDVFFSLLFGGRIVCSAGAFFDSPIALRVFGELFSEPGFEECRRRLNWHPLCLSTDNPTQWTARDYFVDRLRGEKKLVLFREDDTNFEGAPGRDTKTEKRIAAQCIEDQDYPQLADRYAPFLIDYSVEPLFKSSQSVLSPNSGSSRGSFQIEPVLNQNFSAWLKSILDYLDSNQLCFKLDTDRHGILCQFSALKAIESRTKTLRGEATADYKAEELQEMNNVLRGKVGEISEVNAFHVYGQDIYRHYFTLLNSWLDTDWHSIRHAAYDSSAFLLSSTWTDREVFDFDADSKALYLADATIDDSIRLAQEDFGQLDWGILLSLLSDREMKLQRLLNATKAAKTREEIEAATDSILDLLAARIADFEISSDKSVSSILLKKVLKPASITGATHLIATHFHVPAAGWASLLGGAATTFLSNSKRLDDLVSAIPGARKFDEHRVRKQLRTAVVPRIYLGTSP